MTVAGISSRREQVLQALRASTEPLSLADVAARLGVHTNTVRFHVERLVDAGLVEQTRIEHRTAGRPPSYFRAIRTMDPTGPRSFRVLAEILVTALDGRSEEAAEAGRAWGRRTAREVAEADTPTERLVGMLDTLGFAPEVPPDGSGRLELHHCPFLELTRDHRDIVCPIHLGLMQGALETWGADLTADRLDAFVEPDMCLARLGTRGGRP